MGCAWWWTWHAFVSIGFDLSAIKRTRLGYPIGLVNKKGCDSQWLLVNKEALIATRC